MNKYSQEYYITNDNMDKNYRLLPTAAIMYFQDCFARYLTTKNLAAFDIIKQNLYWIVSEYNVEYISELPFWSEKIIVEVWISEVSKIKIYTDFILYHNEKPFVKGNSCWFILDVDTKRPIGTDIVVKNVGICTDLAIGEHRKFKLSDTFEKITEITHINNLSDIDFNNHVNNKSYLNIAAATVSEDFRNTHIIKKLSVKYNKESFIGDKLICSVYRTENKNTFVHKITRDNTPICDIDTLWEETKNIPSISAIQNYTLVIRK